MILALTIIITAILMEAVAWGMHKFIMHGLFWNLHEDHHVKHNHDTFLEKMITFLFFLQSFQSQHLVFGLFMVGLFL